MAANQKVKNMRKLQQTDVRSAWQIVGKRLGKAIQQAAQAGRTASDRRGSPVSREQPRSAPIAAAALAGRDS
jgi:hypothetical protein